MHVIYHLGAHCTDNDRILKCLMRNANLLAQEEILAPPPARYRNLIAETMLKLRHRDITIELQDSMLEAVLEDAAPARLILSNEAFLGVPSQTVGEGRLYPMLDDKIERFTRLFGAHEIEFCLALSNPAVFVSDVFSRAQETDLTTFLADVDPMQLRWSDCVARLKNAAPNARVTVWANEDTPLIWAQVLQAVSGHAPDTKLLGTEDFYASLMSPGGLKRMTGYLDTHPPKDAAHLQRIIAAFLDKFGLEEVIEAEIDLPGWSDGYIAALTDLYEQDLALIAAMDGVRFIAP